MMLIKVDFVDDTDNETGKWPRARSGMSYMISRRHLVFIEQERKRFREAQ